MRNANPVVWTPRQNECACFTHARIYSTREGLGLQKTTTNQNGDNFNSCCCFHFAGIRRKKEDKIFHLKASNKNI